MPSSSRPAFSIIYVGRPILILFLFLLNLTTPGQRPKASSDVDLIHQGDRIEVDVVGSFEFDWRGGLNPEGFLDKFDKVTEPIYARCVSPDDVTAKIAAEYSKFLREPKITVRIIDRNGRALAFIDGAVRSPQRLRIKRDVRLNEVIVLAGGMIDSAGGEISIFRPENVSCDGTLSGNVPGSRSKIIKIADLLSGAEEANPQVVSGELVTVVESLPIWVIGGVGNPGKIAARGEMTLSRAVASSGGVAKNGIENYVTIFRRRADGPGVIEADLKKIREGTAEDPKLEPFDVVDVAQKGSAKRRLPPVIDDRMRSSRNESLPIRVID